MEINNTITIIEQQIESILLSCQRLQNMAGRPGYDTQLVRALKNDLLILESEKLRLIKQHAAEPGIAG